MSLIALCCIIFVHSFTARWIRTRGAQGTQSRSSCGLEMKTVTSWIPGKGLQQSEDEEVTAKSITNEIVSFYSGARVNETIIRNRLEDPEVKNKLDGMHMMTLMFQSARKRRKIKKNYGKTVFFCSFL